jgi:hypothetical protein
MPNMISEKKIWLGGLYSDVPLKHFDSKHESWRELLCREGFNIVDKSDNADVFLFIDIDEAQLNEIHKKSKSELFILIRNEPMVVWPANYSKRNLNKIDYVIEVGRDPTIVPESINWPQFFPSRKLHYEHRRIENRVVMVCGNHMRLTDGELYSLRRRCVHELTEVDLYGLNWNIGTFRRILIFLFYVRSNVKYRDRISLSGGKYWFKKCLKPIHSPKIKAEILSNYRVSLVIENCEQFLTEKIFDSFFAGCLPIYIGPPLANFGIPDHLYIQCLPDIRSIRAAITSAFDIDYQVWLQTMDQWISDQDTKNTWDSESVFLKIIEEVTKILTVPSAD